MLRQFAFRLLDYADWVERVHGRHYKPHFIWPALNGNSFENIWLTIVGPAHAKFMLLRDFLCYFNALRNGKKVAIKDVILNSRFEWFMRQFREGGDQNLFTFWAGNSLKKGECKRLQIAIVPQHLYITQIISMMERNSKRNPEGSRNSAWRLVCCGRAHLGFPLSCYPRLSGFLTWW